MKKPFGWVLVMLTLLFGVFTLGFFLGRQQNRHTVTVSVPAAMQTTPPQTQFVSPTEAEATEPTISFPININTATDQQLQALPGVGEVLARRILAYREANGSFSTVEELLNVEGIGEKRLEDLLAYITTGG